MILFAEATSIDLGPILTALGIGGGTAGFGGVVVWTFRTALPNLMSKFGEFVTDQLAAAKADREAAHEAAERARAAATAERASIMGAHREDMERRDKMLALELARLTEAVTHNTEANARTVAVVESLSATVGVLAARVGADSPEPVAVAPMPKPSSGKNRQLPPGTIRGE